MRPSGFRVGAVTAFAVMAMTSIGAAAEPPARPPPAKAAISVVTQPDWEVRPTSEMMERYFPPIAVMFGISGQARITCHVKIDHTLTDCNVVSEAPAGMGFGSAALQVAREFRMKPETRDGEPVAGASVTIPVFFPIDDDAHDGPPIEIVAGLIKPVDPAIKALAKQLILATGNRERDAEGLRTGFNQVFVQHGEDEGIDAVAVKDMQAALNGAIDHALAQFESDRADYLSRAMSAEELKASVAYFQSEAGKSFINAQTGRSSVGNYSQMIKSIEAEVSAAFCAKRNCPKPPRVAN